ncbi:MAG: S8 family serine peptidase [Pseudomonadota bacterium]
MKPHVIVRLSRSVHAPRRVHWIDARTDKSNVSPLLPDIADLFDRFGVRVWSCAEYKPDGADWSAEERAAGLDRVFRLVLTHNRPVPVELIEALGALSSVEEARMGRIGAARLASEPMSRRAGRPAQSINLPTAHRMTRGEPEVTIAILDTGIDMAHPEFQGRLRDAADFVNIIDGAADFVGDIIDADPDPKDEVGHGSHVAGIAAAAGHNMDVGVAPNCQIMPVRVLATMTRDGESLGAGLIENINAGLKHAIDQGANVINMSLGVEHTGGGLPHQEMVDYARQKGVLLVAASGNDGTETLYYPGAFESVITVGATAPDGDVAGFSTFGRQVKIVAPGENIVSAQPGARYGAASGTSQAAPFVAGAAALVQSVAHRAGGRFSDREVGQILIDSADRPTPRFRDRHAGYGRLNAADAVHLAQSRIN